MSTALVAVSEDDKETQLMISDHAATTGGVENGFFSRICRVTGKIKSAKGLSKLDVLSLSDPYVVIKAIRSTNHLANVHVTECKMNTVNPVWDEEFDFEIPLSWGLEELVGMKCLVFDADGPYRAYTGSDDFLGGADVDMSTIKSGRAMPFELELGGVRVAKAHAGSHKPRLSMAFTVWRETIPKPLPSSVLMQRSMETVPYVREVTGIVLRAKDLPHGDLMGLSDPLCIVRAVLISGQVIEIHRTQALEDTHDPVWGEDFRCLFDPRDQPILLLFDVWDQDDPDKRIEDDGDHLGSAVVPLFSCVEPAPRRRKLWLQGETQRHETRHNVYGTPQRVARREGGPTQGLMPKRTRAKALRRTGSGPNYLSEEEEKSRFKALKAGIVSLKRSVFQSATDERRPILTVEVRTRIKTEPMPFRSLCGKPVQVGDVDDVQSVLDMEDWHRTLYSAPPQLTVEDHPERGLFVAEDHVSFIYGVVHGATGLPMPEGVYKNDAYCIVQGLDRRGRRFFIHRTRVINQTLCPNWAEAFYAAIPEDFQMNRLLFGIYTLPVGQTVEKGKQKSKRGTQSITGKLAALFSRSPSSLSGDEDFDDSDDGSKKQQVREDLVLGRAILDLGNARSGTVLEEEVPILEASVGKQGKITSGFRRQSTLAFEVVVERRWKPCLVTETARKPQTIARRKHVVCRPQDPKVLARPFFDIAHEVPLPLEESAKDVSEFWNTGQLLSAGKTKVAKMDMRWDIPHDEVKAMQKQREKQMEETKRAAQREKELKKMADQGLPKLRREALPPAQDFTKREGMRKHKSLPALKTKFGETSNEDFFSSSLAGPKVRNARWSGDSALMVEDSLRTLRHKPAMNEVVSNPAPDGAIVFADTATAAMMMSSSF